MTDSQPELCRQCGAQLTSTDWRAGHCTQCSHATFKWRLGRDRWVTWNGRVYLLDIMDGPYASDTIALLPSEMRKLFKIAAPHLGLQAGVKIR